MTSERWPFSTWSTSCLPLIGPPQLTDSEADLVAAIHVVPKVELHFHAEGAVAGEASTVNASGVTSAADLETSFFETWKSVIDQFRTYEDFRRAAVKIVAGFQTSGIIWAEVFVSPPDYEQRERHPLPFRQSLAWWVKAFGEVPSSDCEVRLIVDLVRLYPAEFADRWLDDILSLKASGGGASIIGIGLGGPENSNPLRDYQNVVARARDHGLICVAHAGEMGSEEDITEAVMSLDVHRVGHAYGLKIDSLAYRYMKTNGVPVESCPTSSIKLGACADLRLHPIKEWVEHGLPVVVSSDDPALFGTELALEFLNLHRAFGWGPHLIGDLIATSFRCSTMPSGRAAKLTNAVREVLG